MSKNGEVAGFLGSVDPARDTVVFVAEGAAAGADDVRLALWAVNYNVVSAAGDADAAALCARLEGLVPAERRLRVCVGAGKSGLLAYRLARLWAAARQAAPTVVLGDTVWAACAEDAAGTYAGRVILLNSEDGAAAGNDELWRKVVPDLTIVPVAANRAAAVAGGEGAALAAWRVVERANRLWDEMMVSKEAMEKVYYPEMMPEINRLTGEWLERMEQLDAPVKTDFVWKEFDGGLDSFYPLDSSSHDCRRLFVPVWPMKDERFAWWMSMYTERYFLRPEESPAPRYHYEMKDGEMTVSVPGKDDAWVYLVSKKTYPTTYRLEFDYISHQAMEETLQLCFGFDSLISRFRFDLINDNTLMIFDPVRKGMFIGTFNRAQFTKVHKPCSMPLGRWVHVRLEVLEDTFQLFFDDEMVMAVKVKDYAPAPSRWAFIAWSGFKENPMKIQLKNLKAWIPDAR